MGVRRVARALITVTGASLCGLNVAGVGAAHAADALKAPGQASGVYLTECPLFGAGFIKLPGTDTCLDLSGSVRSDTVVSNKVLETDPQTSFYARGSIRMDSRTATEYGTLRSYFAFYMYQQTPGSMTLPTGDDDDSGLASGTQIERAFIQFYGLTAGYTLSNFDFSGGLNYYRPRVSLTKTNQLAYTLQLNPALTATVAIEDSYARQTTIDNDVLGFYGSQEVPDVVGQLLYATPVMELQLSGAMHQINPIGDTYDSDLGYAVQAGFSYRFGIPMAGPELMDPSLLDYQLPRLVLSTAYASGAANYLGFDNDVADAVAYAGDYGLSTGWNVMAAYRHPWSRKWRSSISGSYAELDFAAESTMPDLREFQVGANLVYSPVLGLDIGGEFVFIKQNVPYEDSDVDHRMVGRLRVERRF